MSNKPTAPYNPSMTALSRSRGALLRSLALPLFFLAASTQVFALQADELALVVNARVPAGRKLAEFYSQQRQVPAGRIIELDLPDADEFPADSYNDRVVPAVRKFLQDNHLEQKVTCLVMFYGVPLRIARRGASPAEVEELKEINAEITDSTKLALASVLRLEGMAKSFDPAFKSAGGDDLPKLPPRTDAAVQSILRILSTDADANRRGGRFGQLLGELETLSGTLEITQRLAQPPLQQFAVAPPAPARLAEVQGKLTALFQEMNGLAPKNDGPSRARMRQIAKQSFGVFGYLNITYDQKMRLTPDESEASIDNELSLLWINNYPRSRWQPNPLNYRQLFARKAGQSPQRPAPGATPEAGPKVFAMPSPGPHILMVTRIDAPTEALARGVIETSLAVEKEGLTGRIALDARGKPKSDSYGVYDQTIRDLADLLKSRTKLDVVFDDAEPLFPPHSVKDVAIYCGWYSPTAYVPGMNFKRGAVGFHVASWALVSLHTRQNTGWVNGLMTDGVVASVGPVAEPYLHSFPAADDFFPLLLTGKVTLAEAYWLSNPLTSWMQSCIGDPLYTPYKKNPPLKVEDLPAKLQVIFQ